MLDANEQKRFDYCRYDQDDVIVLIDKVGTIDMKIEFKRRENISFAEIKATSSPYAVRENEKIEIVAPGKPRGYIDQLTITKNERLVLGCVNFLMFATSKQIYWMLSSYDISQDEIHKVLTKMYNAGYLHKLQFTGESGISSYKVYMLTGDRGYVLYKLVFGCKPNTKRSFCERDDLALKVKQVLASNQLMAQLSGLEKSDIPSHLQVLAIKRFFQKIKLVRVTGYFEANANSYLVEAVRRSEDYAKNFESRLERLRYFADNYKKIEKINDAVVRYKPIMIVVAEDAEHMEELMSIAQKNGASGIYFTNDMALLGEWDEALRLM